MAEYELVAVARTPQASGPPLLAEVGPIVAPQITYTSEVGKPGSIAFSCVPDRLDADVRARLLDLDTNPTEVWLRRDGVIVHAGFVAGYQVQGGTLSLTAPGLLGYLAYMLVDDDLTFTAVDQTAIGAALVDQWQALPYGHYGIDTSSVAASGVTRSRDYFAVEQHVVLQRLLELGAAADGFDVAVDPATRELLLGDQGSDLSDGVFLDDRNITDAGVVVSVAPGDLASEAYGLGGSRGTPGIVSKQTNTTLRAAWGRSAVAAAYDGVTVQATLDQHAQRLLDDRDRALFLPGPGLHPVEDADVTDFDAGDLVTYSFDSGLGVREGVFRVASKQVTIDEQGEERMKVGFA